MTGGGDDSRTKGEEDQEGSSPTGVNSSGGGSGWNRLVPSAVLQSTSAKEDDTGTNTRSAAVAGEDKNNHPNGTSKNESSGGGYGSITTTSKATTTSSTSAVQRGEEGTSKTRGSNGISLTSLAEKWANTATSPTSKPSHGLWGVLHSKHNSYRQSIADVLESGEALLDSNVVEDGGSMPYEFTLYECFIGIAVYLLVGVLAFSFVIPNEHWSIIDSLYFSVITFTTIGYGDITPLTDYGRLFATLFLFVGVMMLGIALGVVGSKFVESQVNAVDMAKKEIAKDFIDVLDQRAKEKEGVRGAPLAKHISKRLAMKKKIMEEEEKEEASPPAPKDALLSEYTSALKEVVPFDDDDDDDYKEDKPPRYGLWTGCIDSFHTLLIGSIRYLPVLGTLLACTVIIGYAENWTWIQSIYYFVVTTTTVGYGDYTPTGSIIKGFAIVFCPLAVGSMGHVLGLATNAILERRRTESQKRLWSLNLTMADLRTMDVDQDGKVSELEYIKFMLVAMKLVDNDVFMQLHQHFQLLDQTQSGYLDRKDLELLAMKRLSEIGVNIRHGSYNSTTTSTTSTSTRR